MEELDRVLLRGRCIRTKVFQAHRSVEGPLFLAAAEGKRFGWLQGHPEGGGLGEKGPCIGRGWGGALLRSSVQSRHAMGVRN
jgi:hypothetical protein